MCCNIVDKKQSISNNITDVYNTLGIESARNILLKELCYLGEKKHITILVDCMTVLGKIIPVNSKGVNMIDKSFLSNISYENSLRVLKKQIPFGVQDKIDNINKSLIIGKKPKVGTAIFSILKKPVITIYCNNKNKIKINCLKKTIEINDTNSKIYLNTNINIKKIKSNVYKIDYKYDIIFHKQVITILEINIEKNIEYYFNNNNLTLKFHKKDDLKKIFYNIIQGNNIFEVEIEDNNLCLLDKFFIYKYKNKVDLENFIINNGIKINIKPTNILNSLIKINHSI